VTGGGGLNGGEQLLAGVVQSSNIPRYSLIQKHGKQERKLADSPGQVRVKEDDRERPAAINGGWQAPVHGGEAQLANQVEKEGEEELGNVQAATRSTS
jgi:hypothetical protein